MALATGAFRLHSLHETAAAEAGWGETEEALAARRAAAAVEGGWLRVRPYIVPTERDLVCETHWRPIYRTLLEKIGP